ncbi:MAG: protein kinase [Candidatus Obscuribacter sp.]|nr:protein kinase [Candidatus Obscuribacter sp.]
MHFRHVPGRPGKSAGRRWAGASIDRKYQVLGLLGLGGMGAVYRVKHLGLDKVVALKTLISKTFSMEAWQRFEREARAIARLDHANIIKVLDFGIAENNLPYYTMELVPGESLADRLRRTGPLSLPHDAKRPAEAPA